MNSKFYKCGDVEVVLAIAKNAGNVLGRNVWFKVKLRGPAELADQTPIHRVTGGTIVFREIDEPIAFYRNGKQYKCKLYDEGFSDPDDQ
jgi:hypothetical protein